MWTSTDASGRVRTAALVVALMTALTVTHAARGQCESEELTAPSGAPLDQFGQSVAIDGGVVVVGALLDDDAGSNAGAAHVFRYDAAGGQWEYEDLLLGDDTTGGDHFGQSVAISGELIVAGANLDDDHGSSSGSAYVFRANGARWSQEAKLTASDAAAGDQFGVAVAIVEDLLIVGAKDDDDAGSNSGSVYVFRFNGTQWIEVDKLVASDGAAVDQFGHMVALWTDGFEDVAVVGAYFDDDDGSSSGSAYVFRSLGGPWVEESKLVADDAESGDQFGVSVAVQQNTAVIGARGDDDLGDSAGAAYLFEFDGSIWAQHSKLVASDGRENADFGLGVSISSDIIVVGAPGDDGADIEAGAAYAFEFDSDADEWNEILKLNASDPAAGDQFGWSVSIRGDSAVIAAPFVDGMGDNAGAAYIITGFTADDCDGNGVPDACEDDCNGNGWPDVCDILDGVSQDCNANGIPDECDVDDATSADCNANGVPDECDFDSGASEDCNANGIPDECDIADGTSTDLNDNGIPDTCDPDCNENGVPDFLDILFGVSEDINENGIPDECEDCNGNGIPDPIDIDDGTSEDCNNNGIPDECDLEETTPDCNGNGVPDECDIASGVSPDANQNGIPDECEDCNGNGIPDLEDIAAGTSEDCNGNGVPDECDIAAGTSDDCNVNGVPDQCDLDAGTSTDLNANGIPDECDEDCNENGVPDEIDIEQGTSPDFNKNGIPDECEPDCNNNGIPDFIDILIGVSEDENDNGNPDECDRDCNENDIPDDLDILDGTSADDNANGIPDECDPDCNKNGVPDDLDVTEGGAADENGNGVPDECDPDCNGNDVPDDLDISSGTSEDANYNGVPDECEPPMIERPHRR